MISEERAARPFDVVVWGATGFTGRLVAKYLASKGAKIAIAGRNKAKLEAVRAEIAAEVPAAADLPIRIGDAASPKTLEAIAAETRAIASTVGPFVQYGEPMVAACVAGGADYCDITGEVLFMRRIIDAHHETAKKKGIRIVPACGFDSIPSDLGTLVLATHAKAMGARPLAAVRAYVTGLSGLASGGTLTTMLQVISDASEDPKVRRLLGDPYSLSPDRAAEPNTDGRDFTAPKWDSDAGGWSAPWIMASANTRVVRRSNALFGFDYGRTMQYQEAFLQKGRFAGAARAAALTVGTAAGTIALASSAKIRGFAATKLPQPGEGPSAERRERGYFKLRFYGVEEGQSHATLLVRVEGKGDPGYAGTSRMLGESALCLAKDAPIPGFEGGVLTPATAMGIGLVERLCKVDFQFEATSL